MSIEFRLHASTVDDNGTLRVPLRRCVPRGGATVGVIVETGCSGYVHVSEFFSKHWTQLSMTERGKHAALDTDVDIQWIYYSMAHGRRMLGGVMLVLEPYLVIGAARR